MSERGIPQRVAYINRAQVESGRLGSFPLPSDYMLACRFLGCGIIDRTRSLDQGFGYVILDPIPAPAVNGPTFSELCDTVGDELVREAKASHKDIRVLWSGGIDSTAALIAIMKASAYHGCQDRLEVLLSLDSVHEHPRFFLDHIHEKVRMTRIERPVSGCLRSTGIHITGEHGDQLFGSHLLKSYVERGLGEVDYRDALPFVLLERLRSVRAAHRVSRYLGPVIRAAPVRIHTLFDVMWWLNFSLKWQEVSLRLCVYETQGTLAVYRSLRHFFRDERFQAWALHPGADRCPASWVRYKEAAKHYIRAFSGDDDYFYTKEKEDSLRNLIARPSDDQLLGIWMRDDFRPVMRALTVDRRS